MESTNKETFGKFIGKEIFLTLDYSTSNNTKAQLTGFINSMTKGTE